MRERLLSAWPKAFPYLVTLSAALFFAYELMQFHMMNAIAPLLMKDLRMNATNFGNLCSVYLLADALFLLPAGILLDRFSIRKVILSSLLLCIVGTFSFSFSDSFASAAFSHFLSGIGNAFCFLSCMTLIARWFPEKKQPFIVGLVVTIGMLGGVIAQSPVSYIASILSWRTVLLFDGALGVFIYSLIYLFVYDPPLQTAGLNPCFPFWKGVKLSLNLHNIAAGLYTSLMNLPLMLLGATFGSLFLTQVHGCSLGTSALISSMICMGTIVGSPLYGHFANKILKRKSWLFIGAIASLMSMLLIILLQAPSEFTLLSLFFLLGLFSSSQILSYPLIAENNPKELTGTSMGIAGVIIMGLPMLIGPSMGFLLDWFWTGSLLGQARLYPPHAFLLAFSLFPLGFILSLIASSVLGKEATGDTTKQSKEGETVVIPIL